MTTGKLSERIRDDIEQQAVASDEALRYWKGRGMPQSESYWEGWNDRGGAIAQAIRLQISIDDFDKYTQELLKDRDELVKQLRLELKETQARLRKSKAEVSKARQDAKYQYIKRLLAGGARIVEYESNGSTWYRTTDEGKKINIPYAVIEMLNQDNIQYNLWSIARKAA